jgi:probable lipoprotein NlpC
MLIRKYLLIVFMALCSAAFGQRDSVVITIESFDEEEVDLVMDEDSVLHIESHGIRTKIDSVLTYAEKFIGTRYGYGSTGTKTFDCSGFVLHVYGKHGVQLPHGSGLQVALCEEIKLKKVKAGDLLFFSGRKISKTNIGHVAIVKEVKDKSIVMIHATVQAGVIVEELDKSEYFSKRFIKAGRITQLDEKKRRG